VVDEGRPADREGAIDGQGAGGLVEARAGATQAQDGAARDGEAAGVDDLAVDDGGRQSSVDADVAVGGVGERTRLDREGGPVAVRAVEHEMAVVGESGRGR